MITSNLVSGDAVQSGSTSTIPCYVDVCSNAAAVGSFYYFQPGDVVTDQIGGGRLADLVLAHLSAGGGPCYAIPVTPTWGALPSITHSGSGPSVSVALAPGASGPFDDHGTVFTILQGGANGVALMSCAYDGFTVIETVPVPQEGAGVITGTSAITADTLGKANGLTLVFDQPASKTLTLPAGSLAAAPAGLKAATATSASPVTLTASDLLAAGKAAILANPRKLTFTTAGGTASDAPANVVITGTDYSGAAQTETLNLSQTAGAVTSTKVYATITSLAYPSADGTGATIAIGYADAYASVAELVTELNTLAVAAPLAVNFTDAQTATSHLLACSTTATGTSAVVTLDASPGTLAAVVGYSNSQTSTGTAATFAPPWTGLVWTFTSGTYDAGDKYTTQSAGPTASIVNILAGLDVGRANWRQNPFGFFAITAPPSSAANAAALQAAASAKVNPWRIDNSCPVWVICPTQFHTASATPATNATNITASDNALAAAFLGNSAALDLVAVDDCYVQGSSQLRPGSYRRSAAFAAAVRRATLPKLGSDIAEGIVPGVTLRGPDQVTLARDEFYASVKLGPGTGGSSGPGFSVLKSTSAGVAAPKFAAGVTRAGSTSRFRFSYVVVVGLEMSQTLFARATTWEGQTWPTNPATGSILDSEAAHRAADCKTDLFPLLKPEGKDPSVSDFDVAIDNSGKFVDTGLVPLNGSFVTLGLVLDVAITVTARGTAVESLAP